MVGKALSQSERERELEILVMLYQSAKEYVIHAGYEPEIRWQSNVDFDQVTEGVFLQEAAWVVLSSGFRESVVRGRFQSVSEAFLGWESAVDIVANLDECERRAIAVFGNQRKISAIGEIARVVAENGIEQVKAEIQRKGLAYLRELPFVGPVTSCHLAKNIGIGVVKPDRHLVRMAVASGHRSALEMCSRVAGVVGDSIAVVDVVLWRYATLNIEYETEFGAVRSLEW